ncbi:MAG: valine--tRNA ligase [Candidatus Saccharimonadales bacterium]
MKLSKTYEPKEYESSIYELWESSGKFAPTGSGEPYCILMPPPNANGNLHIGHALTTALQDLMIRTARMQGKNTLYLPGADHAGFETQVVFERKLEAEGKSRFDYSREELYKQIYGFVEQNKDNMLTQIRELGASCDWNHFTYTLDENVIEQTHQTFKKLWDDGLIYRGKRIVNYCTFHQTSFSELEVEYSEEKGRLYEIKYPLENGEGEIVVATTRPETMLGDTAVAVHPEDQRYQKLIGESVKLPLVNRPIPIVADEGVDPEFGTGAVKVTPAHDALDFEIGERHALPVIAVIGHDGRITDEAPKPYHNLTVIEAREAVLADLKSGGFLLSEKKHKHSVGRCYKCDTIIEPMVRDQWLIDTKPLAQNAIKALDEAKIKIVPESKTKVIYHWLKNIKDWNISRQIAWGIPIPAFQNVEDPEDWIYSRETDQEILEINGKTYHRDPDVFDTWFSSGQWPFATLGYPDNQDFKTFYPTAVMETGVDILFFWVTRMLLLGIYITKEVPFKNIYFHGLVMDSHGRKMSKSRGNVIAPLLLAEKYGADALRMGLISGRSPGLNQGFAENKVEGMRNFANKLWNVARFTLAQLSEDFKPTALEPETLADKWIVSRINQATAEITADIEKYRFAQAQEKVYELLWNDFADWYVEASKQKPNLNVLVWGLETILKLTHPFAPFVTEAVWQQLAWQDEMLITQSWPKSEETYPEAESEFNQIIALVSEVRGLRSELNLSKTVLYHRGADFVNNNEALLERLGGLASVAQVEKGRGLPLTSVSFPAWLGVDQKTVKKYFESLLQQQAAYQTRIESLKTQLENKSFTRNAPKAIIHERKESLASAQEKLEQLNTQLERLNTL